MSHEQFNSPATPYTFRKPTTTFKTQDVSCSLITIIVIIQFSVYTYSVLYALCRTLVYRQDRNTGHDK